MASIRRVKGGWRAEVCKRGKRASKTLPTKNEATLWAIEKETVLADSKDTVSGYTMGDAFKRYAVEVSPKKKGEREEVLRMGKLQRDPLSRVPVARVTNLKWNVVVKVCCWRWSATGR